MTKNILVTGAKGQLGKEFVMLSAGKVFKSFVFYFTDKNDLDISNKSDIEIFCEKNEIHVIINCAAYTAVDNAEKDMESANAINHLAVKYLSEVAKIQDIQLLHVSTDYVFDGVNHKPYIETDQVNPQGIYGKTKLDGENAMIAINPPNSIIIRTSWVYSSFGFNFVKTMLRLGREKDELNVIFDQVGTPTYARDLAKTILMMIESPIDFDQDLVAVYHYSNEGVCSWYDFSKAIFELANIDCSVHPITTEQYPTPANRPHYSILNKSKIKTKYNFQIPYWKDSLKECLKILNK